VQDTRIPELVGLATGSDLIIWRWVHGGNHTCSEWGLIAVYDMWTVGLSVLPSHMHVGHYTSTDRTWDMRLSCAQLESSREGKKANI